MSFILLSRCKTDGSYKLPAIYDSTITKYANTIDGIFETLNKAIEFIYKNGNKMKIYYICQPRDHKNMDINEYNDCGNNYYVSRKFGIINGDWTRLCLSNGKPYDTVHKHSTYLSKYNY